MTIEKSFLQTGVGLANTSSIKDQTLEALKSGKEYRHAFVEESVRTRITAQIKALRDREGLDYRQLAERIGKKVSWVYRLEDPNATPPTIPTLLHVAAAFDIGLDVRFRAFSELLEDVTTLEPASFAVPSFDSELNAGAFWKSRRRRKLDPRSRLQRRSMRGRSHSANHVGLGRFSAPADIGSGRLQGALQVASNPWG